MEGNKLPSKTREVCISCQLGKARDNHITLAGKEGIMPIYDFKCRECGKVSEIFLRDAEQVASCP